MMINPGTHRGVPLQVRDRLHVCFTIQYHCFIGISLTAMGVPA